METSDYLRRNQQEWGSWAAEYAAWAPAHWAREEPVWGIWKVPESQVGMLPEVDGRDVVELGCGTAYVSAWLARRGARAIGVDPTPEQLDTARAMQAQHDLHFPLVQAAGEAVPLRDGCADVVISEYGACLWADPYRWIPEAARLLRPGGELVFLTNGVVLMLCMPDLESEAAQQTLRRDYFGMHRFERPDDNSVEFHLGHGDMLRLLRANGFEVEDLIEVRPPAGSTTTYPFVTPEWAQRWPSEEIWKARKR